MQWQSPPSDPRGQVWMPGSLQLNRPPGSRQYEDIYKVTREGMRGGAKQGIGVEHLRRKSTLGGPHCWGSGVIPPPPISDTLQLLKTQRPHRYSSLEEEKFEIHTRPFPHLPRAPMPLPCHSHAHRGHGDGGSSPHHTLATDRWAPERACGRPRPRQGKPRLAQGARPPRSHDLTDSKGLELVHGQKGQKKKKNSSVRDNKYFREIYLFSLSFF